jgi:hypothetical protein
VIAFGLLILVLVGMAGVGAVCVINAVATCLIARRSGRPVALWTVLALIPGVNAATSLYFYLTTILRMLEDIAALKQAGVFADGRPTTTAASR